MKCIHLLYEHVIGQKGKWAYPKIERRPGIGKFTTHDILESTGLLKTHASTSDSEEILVDDQGIMSQRLASDREREKTAENVSEQLEKHHLILGHSVHFSRHSTTGFVGSEFTQGDIDLSGPEVLHEQAPKIPSSDSQPCYPWNDEVSQPHIMPASYISFPQCDPSSTGAPSEVLRPPLEAVSNLGKEPSALFNLGFRLDPHFDTDLGRSNGVFGGNAGSQTPKAHFMEALDLVARDNAQLPESALPELFWNSNTDMPTMDSLGCALEHEQTDWNNDFNLPMGKDPNRGFVEDDQVYLGYIGHQ